MKRFGFLLAAMLLTATASAAGTDQDIRKHFSGDTAAAQAVWSTFEAWLKAYAAGDLDGSMRIFDPAVVFAFQGQKDQTYADLEAGYRDEFAKRKQSGAGTEWVPTVEEVYAQGQTAFVRSVWEGRERTADGVKVTARNRSIDVFRRGADQRWRIFRSLNYPEKPS